MKVYVASAAVQKERARKMMDVVEETGHVVAFDWTTSKEEGGEGEIRRDWRESREEGQELAETEIEACKTSDVTIFVCPLEKWKDRGLGCFIETGICLGSGKSLWIVGFEDYTRDSLFYCAHNVHFLTEEEAKASLEYARTLELDNEDQAREQREQITQSYMPVPPQEIIAQTQAKNFDL